MRSTFQMITPVSDSMFVGIISNWGFKFFSSLWMYFSWSGVRMGKMDFPWTTVLFVIFVWQVYDFSANSVCREGTLLLRVFILRILWCSFWLQNRVTFFLFFIYFVSTRLRRSGEFLGSSFSHSSFPVPFHSIANTILISLFWQVCVCSAKGTLPWIPRFFFFLCFFLFFSFCFEFKSYGKYSWHSIRPLYKHVRFDRHASELELVPPVCFWQKISKQ